MTHFIQQFIPLGFDGYFIDLIKDDDTLCGIVPNICLDDFQENGTHAASDDLYQALENQAVSNQTVTRILPNNNLIDSKFHFFVGTVDQFDNAKVGQFMTGCATEIRTEYQSVYKIESVIPSPMK